MGRDSCKHRERVQDRTQEHRSGDKGRGNVRRSANRVCGNEERLCKIEESIRDHEGAIVTRVLEEVQSPGKGDRPRSREGGSFACLGQTRGGEPFEISRRVIAWQGKASMGIGRVIQTEGASSRLMRMRTRVTAVWQGRERLSR